MADTFVQQLQIFLPRIGCLPDRELAVHVLRSEVAEIAATKKRAAGIAIGEQSSHRTGIVHDENDALNSSIQSNEHVFERCTTGQDVFGNIAALDHERREKTTSRCCWRVSVERR